MDRREFHRQLAAAAAAIMATPLTASAIDGLGAQASPRDQDTHDAAMRRMVDELSQVDAAAREAIWPSRPGRIAMLAYPGMYPLDFFGPKAVFGDLLGTTLHIVAASRSAIAAGSGVQILPDVTLADCPDHLDVLFVPGGGMGTVAMMRDRAVLDFLRRQAATARYLTSVCTGSLVLGTAGLLKGYKATTHWAKHDILPILGAEPVQARFVEDRNRITGGGVTAGIDFALLLAARLAGENYAKALQLNLEYAPAPPFSAGLPAGAGPLVTGAMRTMYGSIVDAWRKAATT